MKYCDHKGRSFGFFYQLSFLFNFEIHPTSYSPYMEIQILKIYSRNIKYIEHSSPFEFCFFDNIVFLYQFIMNHHLID